MPLCLQDFNLLVCSPMSVAPCMKQMLPINAASEQLLDPRWVQQMLPSFEDSCLYDSNPVKACVVGGWSMLVHAGQSITGRCDFAPVLLLSLLLSLLLLLSL